MAAVGHLSLLIAYSAKNKMNFHNLCVCFQPALKIKRREGTRRKETDSQESTTNSKLERIPTHQFSVRASSMGSRLSADV